MEPQSAVHRCLAVKELAQRIVMHCQGSRATLAALARTSSFFSDVALDQLWAEQHALDNLVKCLPSGLWFEGSVSPVPNAHASMEQWSRFDANVARLCVLHIDEARGRGSFRDIVPFLAQRRVTTALFPKLRDLKIVYPNQDLPPIEVLFGPQLLQLYLDYAGSTAVTSLSYLPSFAPNLQALHLNMARHSSIDLIPTVLAQLIALRDLSLVHHLRPPGLPLSSPFCLLLSLLPSLQWFKTNWLAPPLDAPPQIDGHPPFKSLTTLVLHDCLHTNIPAYLSLIRKYKLFSLKIVNFKFASKSTEVGGRDTVKDIIDTVHDICHPARLTRFFLWCPSSGVSRLTMATLEPLLSFKKLQWIRLRNCMEVDDADYERMARAWPELRSVDFSTSGLWEVSPSPAIVLAFVRHCPRLTSLSLEFDATQVGNLHDNGRPGGGISNKQIKKLGVGRSRITFADRFRVAEFLADVFPSLEDIIVNGSAPEKNTWLEVQAIFRGLLVPMRRWQNVAVVEADTSQEVDMTF